MNRLYKPLPLSLFSGLLLWLAWPPTPYSTFLLFIGFVPMLIAVEQIISSKNILKKGTQVFCVSFVGFFVWNTLSVYWVYNSVKTIGALIAIPISLVPYSLGPLLMSSAFWLYYRLRLKLNVNYALAGLVCFWLSYEYLHQWWDLAFPWMTLGNGFATSHQWVQWYEFTGVYGGSIWVLAANCLFFIAYGRYYNGQKKAGNRQFAFGLMLVLLPIVASVWRYHQFREKTDPSNIVVVQPNIDPYEKSSVPVEQQLTSLIHLSDSVAQLNTEFFIWPETALPVELNEDEIRSTNEYGKIRSFLSRYKNGSLLTGIESYRIYKDAASSTAQPMQNGGGFFDRFNAAALFENSQRVQFYHKSKLVPGVEQMPFGSSLSFLKPVFAHLGGSTGGVGKQSEPAVFYAQSGIGAAPVICYESIWGDYVSQYVKKGAQFIAIVTNDGWWENTSGKDQHYQYAKLRAIECRRWVARSANTGISCFINERGDVVKQSKWWVKTALNQTINLNEGLTFYVQYPDLLVYLALISALVFLGLIIFVKPLSPQRK